MSARYDAIIIGAGIIGACTAFELAKRGWRTLNLDKLPAAGYGSTGSSCAIIRTHYSTLDGAALAYEGYFCWDDWAGYLEAADERGPARFHKTDRRWPFAAVFITRQPVLWNRAGPRSSAVSR